MFDMKTEQEPESELDKEEIQSCLGHGIYALTGFGE